MAQSPNLGPLRDALRKNIESQVAALSEEATDEDFVNILGSVSAMRQVAMQIVDVEQRIADARAAGAPTTDLDSAHDRLVDALRTLTREMSR